MAAAQNVRLSAGFIFTAIVAVLLAVFAARFMLCFGKGFEANGALVLLSHHI